MEEIKTPAVFQWLTVAGTLMGTCMVVTFASDSFTITGGIKCDRRFVIRSHTCTIKKNWRQTEHIMTFKLSSDTPFQGLWGCKIHNSICRNYENDLL